MNEPSERVASEDTLKGVADKLSGISELLTEIKELAPSFGGISDLSFENQEDGVQLTLHINGQEKTAFFRHGKDGAEGPKGEKGDKGEDGKPGRDGRDGTCTVNGQVPDGSGNITLLPEDLGALPAEGGSMTGNLVMNGNLIRNMGEPTRDTDAANKAYVDGKRTVASFTLDPANWEGDGPYTQSVVVAFVKDEDLPHVTPRYDSSLEVARNEIAAWQCVSFAIATNGIVTFTCLDKKPDVYIPFMVEVFS